MEDTMANPQHTRTTALAGQWAKQQQEGMKRQEKKTTENEARRVAEGGEADRQSQQRETKGDNRTPDEPIGVVAYADREPVKKKTGEF
jgi:hypothetical protein